MGQFEQDLQQTFSNYSIEDLLKSFFVLNMWLPNVASPIKMEYLYSSLEAAAESLPKKNKVLSYVDFSYLCEQLIAALPDFSMLEDYVPETDRGEIRYYFGGEFYNIFYGGSLSNAYDFYSAFEIIHIGFEDLYRKTIDRSPKKELTFCLSLQHELVSGLDLSTGTDSDLTPGHIEVPDEAFWMQANAFLSQYSPQARRDTALLDKFSYEPIAGVEVTWPNMDSFSNRYLEGKNCFYFFIKWNGRYFPVLPRRYLSVLYDTWGQLLRTNFSAVQDAGRHIDQRIEIELFKYTRDRLRKNSVFGLVSAVNSDSKPHSLPFAVGIYYDGVLHLIHCVPISKYIEDFEGYMQALSDKLREVHDILSQSPLRIMVLSEKKIIEISPGRDGATPKIVTIVVSPYLTTELRGYALPNEFSAVIMTMDQLLGIIDELEDAADLTEFMDYRDGLLSSTMIGSLTSPLDLLASFKKSHSVLIRGATVPTFLSFDPNSGSEYRYQSLSFFWTRFPSRNFMGHPRSWAYTNDGPANALISRVFKSYVYHQEIGKAVFFVNAPVHLIKMTVGLVVDSVMQMIQDALNVYSEEIEFLTFCSDPNTYHVFCAPSSAVLNNSELKHLSHLLPNDQLWSIDAKQTAIDEFSMAMVIDDERLTEVLIDATDRTVQIDLLLTVLEQIDVFIPDGRFPEVARQLAEKKQERNRVKLFAISKEVTFPDPVRVILPESRQYKLADKQIARIASDRGVLPEKYQKREAAHTAIKNLIEGLVAKINARVAVFSFDRAIPELLANIDALVHEHKRTKTQIQESILQEVEYDRETRMGTENRDFIHDHQTHRYLIEKFVQIKPGEQKSLSEDELREMLALGERLLNLYAASDALHYDILPAKLEITQEFIAVIKYADDFEKKGHLFGIEQSRMALATASSKTDTLEPENTGEAYLSDLDSAFREDLGFGLKDVANVGTVLSCWANCSKDPESQSYNGTLNQITAECVKHIPDYDPALTDKILEFLTLKNEEVLEVLNEDGDGRTAVDIPVWEYAKRVTRYTIRPLIKTHDGYCWGPYSVSRAARLWTGAASSYRLPAPVHASQTKVILAAAHKRLEKAIEQKCKEIMDRHAIHSLANVFPHEFDSNLSNIGDFDVIALLDSLNVIVSVESKIIDPAYCIKDSRRLQQKIFGRTKQNGEFQEGYLHKVEKRHEYLKSNALKLIEALGWKVPDHPPAVLSLFVTQIGFWWTRFPVVKTEVEFVELSLLDHYVGQAKKKSQ